jgi:hypothetical protein
MSDDALPPDLAALERELSAHGEVRPSADLRRRVLAAVGEELADRPRRWSWRLAFVAAAAVLLWINFSMSVTNNAGWPRDAGYGGDRLQETARRIRDLVPDMPESEVYRQALLARAGASLSPTPPPLAYPYRLQPRKE